MIREQPSAQEDVHPLDWTDDFGPLDFTRFNELVRHMRSVEGAGSDLMARHACCVALGYRDISHFERVQTTFLKYYGRSSGGDTLRFFVWDDVLMHIASAALEHGR